MLLPYKSFISQVGTLTIALSLMSLPMLINLTVFAQTSLAQSQCTDVKIKKHIQQLDKGETADFNALVACQSKAVPALIKALEKNKNENSRIIVIAALGEIGTSAAPAVPILNGLLKDKSENVRIITLHTLEQIGKNGVPSIIQALRNNDNWIVRYSAADALGNIDPSYTKDAVPALIQALRDKDWYVRSKAADSLGKMDKAAVPYLIAALKDNDSYVRYSAADALGQIGAEAKNAIPVLKIALQDNDEKVRTSATYALDRINSFATNQGNRQTQVLSNSDRRYEGIRERIICEQSIFSPEVGRNSSNHGSCSIRNSNFAQNTVVGGTNQMSTQMIEQTTRSNVITNPPVMCRIPVIKSVFSWKCP